MFYMRSSIVVWLIFFCFFYETTKRNFRVTVLRRNLSSSTVLGYGGAWTMIDTSEQTRSGDLHLFDLVVPLRLYVFSISMFNDSHVSFLYDVNINTNVTCFVRGYKEY